MADQRLTTNAQPQPLSTSVNRTTGQEYVYSSNTGVANRPGTLEYSTNNAGISGNINAVNTGARLTGPGVVPTNANVTNAQYGVTSAYSSSYKSGGYASGYNPNVNSKTPVHFNSGSNYYAPVGNVEKKVVIPNSGPAYSVKEEYQQIKSPGRVTYQRRNQQIRPTTGYATVQPTQNIQTTNSTYVPLQNRSTYSQQPASAAPPRPTSNAPQSSHHEQKNKCPLPLLILLGLLGITGIILGLLFGLGVIGGRNGGGGQPVDKPVSVQGVDYSPYSVTIDTTVVNTTASGATSGGSGTTTTPTVSGTSSTSGTNTQPTKSPTSTSTSTTIPTTKPTIPTTTPTTTSTTPTTSPTTTSSSTTPNTSTTTPTTSVTTTTTTPTTSVSPPIPPPGTNVDTVTFNTQPTGTVSVAPIPVQPVSA